MNSQQYCTFLVNGLLLGVEVQKVQEVLRFQEMTRVPLAPPIIAGLVNLRGQIITAIDLRTRLDLPPRLEDALPTNVVVQTNEAVMSFLVDEIGDVIEVEKDTFEPTPRTVEGNARDLIRGVHKLAGRLLLVLDIETAGNAQGMTARESN